MSSGRLKSSSVQVILFGVFGMLSISSLLYFYFFWRRDNTLIKRITPSSSSSSSSSSENNDDKANKKDDIKEEIIVEDVEDDEEEEEEEEEEVESEEVDEAKANEEKEALRLKYDNANRIAMKYISGQAYEKAIEKLTEALELACIIPNANKDILTLYNNRSAMYEKNNNYDKALTDISVILAIEFNHLKARIRRARIYEAQAKLNDALDEYMFVVTVQQRKGEQPGFQMNMDNLIKTLATQSTPKLFQQIRTQNTLLSLSKELPSKSQCKNFLQSYPSQFCWKDHYLSTAVTTTSTTTTGSMSREDLVVKYDEALSRYNNDAVEVVVAIDKVENEKEEDEEVTYDRVDGSFDDNVDASAASSSSNSSSSRHDKYEYVDVLRTGLDVICYDLIHAKYNHAFDRLKLLPLSSSTTTTTTTTTEASSSPTSATLTTESIENIVTSFPSLLSSSDESKQSIDVTFITPFVSSPSTITDSSSVSSNNRFLSMLESLRYELIGFEHHLRCNMVAAIDAYKTALHHMPINIDARMKLANVYLEDGDVAIANKIFQEILDFMDSLLSSSSLSTASIDICRVYKAWALLHHSAISVTRTETGVYVDDCITKSTVDIDAALSLLDSLQHIPAGKAGKVTGLIRVVHLLLQNKPMVGEAPTAEDNKRCLLSIMEAKKIDPNNESVVLLEAEHLSNDSKFDEALQLIDKLQNSVGGLDSNKDSTPYYVRASIMINKAMSIFQNPYNMTEATRDEAKTYLHEADALYKQALSIEPNAIEVINQYAQFSCLLDELERAVILIKQAIPLARTKDDLHDLNQLLIMYEARLKASETMKNGY